MMRYTGRINTICFGEQRYPEALRYIDSPPKELYYIGNLELLDRHKVAVIGSRKASTYGKWVAYGLSKRLTESCVTVVSGLACGIDEEAHKGGLSGEGRTIAVLGCGIDICYPRSSRSTWEKIIDSGLILSEYGPGVEAKRYTFPLRNRIISGLCSATVVVEAGIKSGSLITADHAINQGRDVYAVPGNMDRRQSLGCNKLIHDGAKILVTFDDVLHDMGLIADSSERDHARILDKLGADERIVYESLVHHGEITIDAISMLTGKSIPEITGIVSVLEMKGHLHFDSGKVFIEN